MKLSHIKSGLKSVKDLAVNMKDSITHKVLSYALGVKSRVDNTLDIDENNTTHQSVNNKKDSNKILLKDPLFAGEVSKINNTLKDLKKSIKGDKLCSKGLENKEFELMNTLSDIEALREFMLYLKKENPEYDTKSLKQFLDILLRDYEVILNEFYSIHKVTLSQKTSSKAQKTIDNLNIGMSTSHLDKTSGDISKLVEKLETETLDISLKNEISKLIYIQTNKTAQLLNYLDDNIFGVSFNNAGAIGSLSQLDSSLTKSSGAQAINNALSSGSNSREFHIKSMDSINNNSVVSSAYNEIFQAIELLDNLDSLLSVKEGFNKEQIKKSIGLLKNNKIGAIIKTLIIGSTAISATGALADTVYSPEHGAYVPVDANGDIQKPRYLEEIGNNTSFNDIQYTSTDLITPQVSNHSNNKLVTHINPQEKYSSLTRGGKEYFSKISSERSDLIFQLLKEIGADVVEGDLKASITNFLADNGYTGPVQILGKTTKKHFAKAIENLEVQNNNVKVDLKNPQVSDKIVNKTPTLSSLQNNSILELEVQNNFVEMDSTDFIKVTGSSNGAFTSGFKFTTNGLIIPEGAGDINLSVNIKGGKAIIEIKNGVARIYKGATKAQAKAFIYKKTTFDNIAGFSTQGLKKQKTIESKSSYNKNKLPNLGSSKNPISIDTIISDKNATANITNENIGSMKINITPQTTQIQGSVDEILYRGELGISYGSNGMSGNGEFIYGENESRFGISADVSNSHQALSTGLETGYFDIYLKGQKQKKDDYKSTGVAEEQETYGVGVGKKYGDNSYLYGSISKTRGNDIFSRDNKTLFQAPNVTTYEINNSWTINDQNRLKLGLLYDKSIFESTDFSQKTSQSDLYGSIHFSNLSIINTTPILTKFSWNKKQKASFNFTGYGNNQNFGLSLNKDSVNLNYTLRFGGKVSKPTTIDAVSDHFVSQINDNLVLKEFSERKEIDVNAGEITSFTFNGTIPSKACSGTITMNDTDFTLGNLNASLVEAGNTSNTLAPLTITQIVNGVVSFTCTAPTYQGNAKIKVTGKDNSELPVDTISSDNITFAYPSSYSPNVGNDTGAISAGASKTFNVTANDTLGADPSITNIDITGTPTTTEGTITISPDKKSLIFVANANTSGSTRTATITYQITNNLGLTATGTLTVDVLTEPTIQAVNVESNFGTTYNLDYNSLSIGVDLSTLTITSISGGTSSAFSGGITTITPSSPNGLVTANISGQNSEGKTVTSTITIDFLDQVIANNASGSQGHNAAAIVDFAGFSSGGTIAVTQPSGWTITNIPNSTSYSITPPNAFAGAQAINYSVTNNLGQSQTATYTTTVASPFVNVNVANSSFSCSTGANNFQTLAGAAGTGLTLDTISIDNASLATVSQSGMSITITPLANAQGTATISGVFRDSGSGSENVSCTVDIDTLAPSGVISTIFASSPNISTSGVLTFSEPIQAGATAEYVHAGSLLPVLGSITLSPSATANVAYTTNTPNEQFVRIKVTGATDLSGNAAAPIIFSNIITLTP